MTDRLDLANAIEAAGIARKAAETIAGTIFDAVRENVATKADIEASELRIRNEITDIHGQLKLHNWMLTFMLAMRVAILFRVFWH